MAGLESTAIVDMLRQMANKPLPRDSAPDLFAAAPAAREPRQPVTPRSVEIGAVLPFHAGAIASLPIRRDPPARFAPQRPSALDVSFGHVREMLSHRRVWWLLGAAAVIGGLAAIRFAHEPEWQPPTESAGAPGAQNAVVEPGAPNVTTPSIAAPVAAPTVAVTTPTIGAPTIAAPTIAPTFATPTVARPTIAAPGFAPSSIAPTVPSAQAQIGPSVGPVIAQESGLIDVRLDSQPGGASVTLVDGSRSSPVGNTPLAVSLDASHSYDVVFALNGHAPKLVHLDPRATPSLVVPFDSGRARPADATSAAVPAPVRATVAARAAAPSPEPAPSPHRPRRAPTRVASRDDGGGSGVLMISTKPPCQITIDGTPTGLTTPQRSIDLTAGMHRVTLTNSSLHVAQTISVRVTANASTKLVRDLMK